MFRQLTHAMSGATTLSARVMAKVMAVPVDTALWARETTSRKPPVWHSRNDFAGVTFSSLGSPAVGRAAGRSTDPRDSLTNSEAKGIFRCHCTCTTRCGRRTECASPRRRCGPGRCSGHAGR